MGDGHTTGYPVSGPVVTGGTGVQGICSPVSLAAYARTVGIPSLLFWGVKRGTSVPDRTQYYSTEDRFIIQSSLNQAVRTASAKMRVYLCPQWTAEEEVGFYTEILAQAGYRHGSQQVIRNRNPIELEWHRFIEAGQAAFSVYAESAVIVYSGDYGTVTVPHGDVGNTSEVRIYYANGLYESGPEPSLIQWGTNNIEITFPKERLVDPDATTRALVPADWDDISDFLTEVTVARVYNDPSVNANVRVLRGCNTARCVETTTTACVFPTDRKLSRVSLFPAGYQNGQWCRRRSWSGTPDKAFVYYRSGLESLPWGYTDALIRLAHTLIPEAPCPTGHQPQDRFWARDRMVSNAVTRERINCPWGTMDGAWYSWNFFTADAENFSLGGGFMGGHGVR